MIEGDLAIHTQAIVDGKLQLSREPIDYSEAIGAVYHKELVFTHVLQNIRTLGPVVGVTNVPGDTEEFLRTLSTLDLEPEHIVVSFSGDGCAEGIFPQSGLEAGIGYGSSTSLQGEVLIPPWGPTYASSLLRANQPVEFDACTRESPANPRRRNKENCLCHIVDGNSCEHNYTDSPGPDRGCRNRNQGSVGTFGLLP